LCNFLHSPVTSSLLVPNILLSTLFSNIYTTDKTKKDFDILKTSDQMKNKEVSTTADLTAKMQMTM
jgi:hypothetical protein